jgi:hypothetical protein
MKLPHQQVIDYLTQQGFKQSKTGFILHDCDFTMYKRTTYSNTRYCPCNDKVPQILVKGYSCTANDETHFSYEVELCQENDLGWVNFNYYGISLEDLISKFDKYEESLIKAWVASFIGDADED